MLHVFQCKTYSWKSLLNVFAVHSNKQVSPSKDERLRTEPNRRNNSTGCRAELPPCLPARRCARASCPREEFCSCLSWSSPGHTRNVSAEILPHRQQLQVRTRLGRACPQNMRKSVDKGGAHLKGKRQDKQPLERWKGCSEERLSGLRYHEIIVVPCLSLSVYWRHKALLWKCP